MRLGLDAFSVPTIRDDAGVEREIFNPMAVGETDPEVRELSVRIVLHDQQSHQTLGSKVDLAMFLPMTLAPVAAIVLTQALGISMAGPLGPILVFAPMMAAVVPLMRRRMRRRMAEKTRDTLLGCGRCPACAYAAAAIPPDPADGLLHCPECDARWRPDRFTALPSIPPPADQAFEHAGPDKIGSRALLGAALVHDARGAVRRLGDFRARPDLRPVAAEIAAATRVRRTWTTLGWALLFTLIIASQAYSLRSGVSNAGLQWGLYSFLPMVGALMFVVLGAARVRASWLGRSLRCSTVAAEILRRHGRCPACLEPLHDAPPGEPVPCPRCHALWPPGGGTPNPASGTKTP